MASNDEKVLAKARALEKKVLRHNDIDAMVDLAQLLLSSHSFVSQRARGIQLLERAIKQANDPYAMFELSGYLLESAYARHHSRAVSLLERSLKLDEDSAVANRLAVCYLNGHGVAKDTYLAVQLFERAFRVNQHPTIMFNLGLAILRTPQLHAENKNALALINRSYQLSLDAVALNDLGTLYHEGGTNLGTSFKKASKWYRRAIRASNLPNAKINLAKLLLENEPSSRDVQIAIRLLEDVRKLEGTGSLSPPQLEITFVELANAYAKHDIDPLRALQLYETAAIGFNSNDARYELHCSWVHGMNGMRPDHARIFQFCLEDGAKNRDDHSLVTAKSMLWTGTKHIKMNRKKVIEFSSQFFLRRHHNEFSLFLRHDMTYYPSGRKGALRIMKKLDDNMDRSNLNIAEAIVLSEKDSEVDKLFALRKFQQPEQNDCFVWLLPYLRRSKYFLPFDGHLRSVTKPMRKFSSLNNMQSLNLASLLLEIEGKQQEAVKVLEDLMNTELRLIAVLNLAYILMNDVRGVTKNWARGMQILEDAVKDTNDVSARAMLANAVSEETASNEDDLERGWLLWQTVEEDEKDEEELGKVGRLVSEKSKKRWASLARQQQKYMIDRDSDHKGQAEENSKLNLFNS